MEPEQRRSHAKAISEAVVRTTHDYTGRGPTKARTYITDDVVTVVLADTLTKGERTIAEGGEGHRVLELRLEFQRLMRVDLVSAVELELERKVAAFMSANHIEPDMAAEVFVLAPAE